MGIINFREWEQKQYIRNIGIIIGSAITAFGLAGFLVPHRIVAGGTSGLATIFYHLTGLPIGILVIAIDIPLFIWSFSLFGFRFLAKTFAAALLMAFFLQIFNFLFSAPFSPDPLLSALYGGLITGLGMGLIFRFGATSGGTDLAAAICRHYFGWKLGTGLFLADGLVIALSGIIFDVNLILYGILAVFICTRIVDFVQEGTSSAKGVFIISDKAGDIKNVLYDNIPRGITIIKAKGGYKGLDKDILFSVILPAELSSLRSVVNEVDPTAFVVVVHAAEALGEGFIPIAAEKKNKNFH